MRFLFGWSLFFCGFSASNALWYVGGEASVFSLAWHAVLIAGHATVAVWSGRRLPVQRQLGEWDITLTRRRL